MKAFLMQSEAAHKLNEGSKAFDSQIEERLANEHILAPPYARLLIGFTPPPARRPAYVELDFCEQFKLTREGVKLARCLGEVVREPCREGALSATEFFYIGRKRPETQNG